VLLTHPSLAVFIAAMTATTVVIICISYSQIIALFPTGGGGYVVASRLLSPSAGVVSGSALLIDYVLTIVVSVASGWMHCSASCRNRGWPGSWRPRRPASCF